MKAKIHIIIYKDKPLWYTAANEWVIVDLSNKNDPEVIAHKAKELFLKLLEEIKKNEENQTKEKDNKSECEGSKEEAEEAKS